MLKEQLENVRSQAPLVHNITNYVTVNDCANILLACGGSPIMADDPAEAADITSICGGLNINIGTLNQSTIPAMLAAGKKANQCGRPVLLDPVGAGASPLRTQTAGQLLDQVSFTAIRGNVSEIKALSLGSATTRGVDADLADAITEDNLDESIRFAQDFSARTGAVIAITGVIDLVCDRQQAFIIRNGHPMLSRITGSGCMLSAMMAAYLTANRDTPLAAAAAAVCAMGLCGEIAYSHLKEGEGSGTFRSRLIDAVYCLSGDELERGANYEVR
ncbi:hydroxyethylthiazole kinase [Ihubacter massiliensis]|uniref:Hydroxyethylthiazole kinase n=1 Tax=Hominibacterium faecale TaxID=2839743 RepID=A0A9J6QHI7_9FIRM|nr:MULTISPECIES: hydroxyethylthiazole kinase [Eubacteriales Family XIII. Incertae Sedis]MCI7302642.1 hydroxyethylthiazole kinase [Clostridia bacterium]MCO7122702.1 hydroxyethylthiazole kinase [Ihubacter massiliensis]MCU7376976.1 hydroxyethylthiazole kinase [Hominibacterium faecale]MDY3010878.1 hydroxyethylthiazole kinase [Clostridiales Family XIII bacterium]